MGGHYEKDIMRQLQEVLKSYDEVKKEIKDTKTAHKKDIGKLKSEFAADRKVFKKEIKELKAENKQLKSKVSQLEKKNSILENENSKLRSQINNDSNNSSLPPSTDQKGRRAANEYNGRTKSKKSCGGQCGHRGKTLEAAKIKEKIESGELKREIVNVGCTDRPYEIRYIVDLNIEPIVKEIRFHEDENGRIAIPPEYRALVQYGEVIRAMAVQLYGEGVVANDRIADFINSVTGNKITVSTGSVYNFLKNFSKRSAGIISDIKEALMKSELIYTDATHITVNGKQAYIRNQSTEEAVLYSAMDSKSKQAIEDQTILGEYQGILVHDHEKVIYNYGTKHGECNVHLLRYLKKNTEETKNKWSDDLSALLLECNKKRKEYFANKNWFSKQECEVYEAKYDKIIKRGFKQNQKTQYKYAKSDEYALLNRLKEYKENHLMFIYDSRVAFDNNMSERDLRKCKNRQKMAGGFRTAKGQEMYCTILSVIETCKRKGENIFGYIKEILKSTTPVNA